MKTRRLVLTGLVLLSGWAVAQAQVKLSFNPAKGAKYEYVTEVTQNIKQNAMGQEIPVEMDMAMKYLVEVKEKSAQETRAQFTYQEVSYIVSSPMMKMGYDSKNPVENPSDTDKALSRMFGSLIGKPFTLTVAPDGSVKSVTGMDAIAESMVQSAGSDDQTAAQMSASIKQQFSESAIKQMFEQSLKFYPDKAVKPGDSWTTEGTTGVANMNMNIKTGYTLKDVKKNVATVAVESTIDMNPGAGLEGMDGKLSGTQTGVMTVDVKTGMTISSDLSMDIKGAFKTQGIEIKMDMTTKAKISIKEIK